MSLSLITALSCLAVMLLFFFIWLKQFNQLRKISLWFFIVYIIGWVAFIATAIFSVIKDADYAFDWTRKLLIWETVIACIWYAAWCSQYKMDQSDGIARKD